MKPASNTTLTSLTQLPRSVTTAKAYRRAVDNYRNTYRLPLPAQTLDVLIYISRLTGTYTYSTISQRVRALGAWHSDFGLPDPTNSDFVRLALRESKRITKRTGRDTIPFEFESLTRLVELQNRQLNDSIPGGNTTQQLRGLRNRALLLLCFWLGLHGNDIRQLRAEHIYIKYGDGMQVYLANTQKERIVFIPYMEINCPVAALSAWLEASGITHGPIFVNINRAGELSYAPLHSVHRILKSIEQEAGIKTRITLKSLRLGLGEWAKNEGWRYTEIMEHLGLVPVRRHNHYIR